MVSECPIAGLGANPSGDGGARLVQHTVKPMVKVRQTIETWDLKISKGQKWRLAVVLSTPKERNNSGGVVHSSMAALEGKGSTWL